MLGLLVLLGLIVWIAITLVSIKGGAILGKAFIQRKNAQYIGAFLGFMLVMGGFIVYWMGEYVYLQAKVTNLCETKGGITVYVTPEQWRKEIGEEEWGNLPDDWKNINQDMEFTFNGKTYYGSTQLNRRVISYEAKDERRDRIADSDTLFIDKPTNTILFREHYFSVGVPAIANSLEGLKFWLNEVNDCYIGKWSYKDRFFTDEYTNRQISKGK